MSTKHTAEPWSLVDYTGRTIGSDGDYKVIATCNKRKYHNMNPDEARANAERIIACVNAMSGIDNPERYIKESMNHAARIWSIEDKISKLVGMLEEATAIVHEHFGSTQCDEGLKAVEWEVYLNEFKGGKS